MNSDLGFRFYMAHLYDLAIKQYRTTLEMDLSFYRAHFNLGLAYEQKAMYEQAIAEFQKAIELSGGNLLTLAALGHAYAMAGRRGEAREILERLRELSKQSYVSPFCIAWIYAGLDEKDLMFEWLQKAYEERSGGLVFLKVNPIFDRVRSDPRFADLVRRVGLPP